jgi:hypothetical protein
VPQPSAGANSPTWCSTLALRRSPAPARRPGVRPPHGLQLADLGRRAERRRLVRRGVRQRRIADLVPISIST